MKNCELYDIPEAFCAHCLGLLDRRGEDKSQKKEMPTFDGLLGISTGTNPDAEVHKLCPICFLTVCDHGRES